MLEITELVIRRGSFRLHLGHLRVEGRAAILGRNGAGKTTLLRSVAGLIRPAGGSIKLDGREITGLPPGGRGVGYMPQEFVRLPLKPREAITYFAKIFQADHGKLVDSLGLHPILEKDALSAGESQIINLAIILLRRPKLLLLDEPTNALDHTNRRLFWNFLKTLDTPMLYVTHDPFEAAIIADSYYLLENGEIHGPYPNTLRHIVDEVMERIDSSIMSPGWRKAPQDI